MILLDRITDAMGAICLHSTRLEADVVAAIMSTLQDAVLSFEREVWVAPRCRVDIVVEGCIVIEVKRGKPNTKTVSKQVRRYAAGDGVEAVVLVSERGLVHHINEAHGKPVRYVALSRNWGLTT